MTAAIILGRYSTQKGFSSFSRKTWTSFVKEIKNIQVIKIHQYGGPEVLKLEEVLTPIPSAGWALVKVTACGVNFIDIYQRTGLYKKPLPVSLGLEGAGIVESLGPDGGKSLAKPGDRVGWTGIQGSYATHVLVPYDRLIVLPQKISLEQAAAGLLQGMTAHYLSHSVYPLNFGDICLIHAAAGGVGQLLTQMARMKGARVIGTVSTEEKAKIARESGANSVILYTQQNVVTEVKRITEEKGVNVVYDSVGKNTWEKSLDCLAKRGMLVSFGQSSGPVPPFDIQILNNKGSLFLTRPSLQDYVDTSAELLHRSTDVIGWILSGKLKLRVHRTYPLSEAAEAHKALENRQTMGKLLLIPPDAPASS